MTIETSFDSNYRKVLVAARRARQIQSGSAALVPEPLDEGMPDRARRNRRRQDFLRQEGTARREASCGGERDSDSLASKPFARCAEYRTFR